MEFSPGECSPALLVCSYLEQVSSSPGAGDLGSREGAELHGDFGEVLSHPWKICCDLVPKAVLAFLVAWNGEGGGQRQGAGAPSRARACLPAHPPSELPWVAWKAFHAGQAPSAVRSTVLSPPPKSPRPPECTLTTSLSVAHVFTNWGMSKSKGIPHDIIRIKMSTGWQFIESIHGRWGGLRLSNCLIPAETQGRCAFGKPGCAGGLQPVQRPTGGWHQAKAGGQL